MYILLRHNRLWYSVNVTVIGTGKPKYSCDPHYFGGLDQTRNISEVCVCFLWMHLVCLLIHLCSLDPLQLSPLSSPPPCTQRTKNESPVDSPGSPVLSQDGQATSSEVLSCYYCQNSGYSGRAQLLEERLCDLQGLFPIWPFTAKACWFVV